MKTNTLRICSWGLIAATLMICFQSASAGKGPREKGEPDYTKGEEPATRITRWAIGPTGAHGHFYHKDPRQILIEANYTGIDQGSPADGKLRGGDVILGVIYPTTGQDTGNGKFTFDARRSMAIAIEEAEKKKHGGKLVLNVWRPKGETIVKMIIPPGKRPKYRDKETNRIMKTPKVPVNEFVPAKPLTGSVMPVELTLPVMGTYSATTPYECEKNEALVKKLTKTIGNLSGMPFDALGLLATGDEAHIPRLQEFARELSARVAIYDAFEDNQKESDGKITGAKTWYVGYDNLFLCEYYLATGDKEVLPGIKGASMFLAQGVSGVGTWSHGIADVGQRGMYSHASAYGAMNQVSLVCTMSLVLAQKCGVEDPAIDKAIRMGLDFYRYYVDKGSLPYGDHPPQVEYDNNGRMSVAAVLYDLVGDKEAAEYFTKMSLASYETREEGHTGHFFAWNWGPLAAARAGPEAAGAFQEKTRYFLELERRHDGRSVYQPQLPEQSRKTYGYGTTGQRLTTYCLPRKALYITGKGGSCVTPITGDKLKAVMAAPLFNPAEHPTELLLAALGHESLVLRNEAAQELGRRDDDVVDKLIAMLDSPNRYATYGACEGLRYAGRGSTEAVDALVHKMENDKDMTLRYFAIQALQLPEEGKEGNGLGNASKRATNALLKLAAEYDPVLDPQRKLGRQISFVLFCVNDAYPGFFCGRFWQVHRSVNKLDKSLLIPALKEILRNPNSEARGNAMRVTRQLSDEDLNQMWGEIYEAVTVPAPSGVMFADQTHIQGIQLMAEHKIKEGLDFGYWYAFHKWGWGAYGRRKRGGVEGVVMYGRAAETYFEDIELALDKNWAGSNRASKELKEKLDAARQAPMPELTSIAKYINNKPERPFLEWKADGAPLRFPQSRESNKPQPQKNKASLPTTAKPRVFTDTEGRTITAELQSVNGREITIKRKDGQVFTISLDLLSADDRTYAKKWESKRTAK